MKLIPLRKEQFPCLRALFAERIKEGKMEGATTVDHAIKTLETAYDARCAGAYVDSVESPTCFLVMNHYQGILVPEIVASVAGIHIATDKRGDVKVAISLIQAAEAYARANGASSLMGASWVYRGAEPIDALWLRHGFEPREHIFIKHLK